MSNEKNETIDASTVYEMFEEVKASQAKQLAAIEEMCSKPAASSEPVPVLDPEDGKKIETLAEKLDSLSGKLDCPLKHHHTLDFMGNRALIALAVAIGTLFISLWGNHNQQQAIVRNRDNDLKYRYIQMRGEATPADVLQLRNVFEFDRSPDSIEIIRQQVIEYERIVREQAEQTAQAKLNAAEAQRLQNQAETVKEGR